MFTVYVKYQDVNVNVFGMQIKCKCIINKNKKEVKVKIPLSICMYTCIQTDVKLCPFLYEYSY